MALNAKQMVSIEISQETYSRLQQRAVPFKDSPDTVISRLLNEPSPQPTNQGLIGGPSQLGDDVALTGIAIDDPFNPPSLKHTKVLRAEVAGKQIDRANWTTVRQSLIEIAFRQRAYNLHQLLEVCPVNAQEGVKADEGYTPCEDLGVSIQGQDANHAWQAAAALAKALRVPVKVWFHWRTKADAEFRGKRSLLAIDPLRS
ncbi:MAG: hypothetical protein OXE83_02595 [Gammaproteobacteria bacterium]|nr:hypothetical protein [Gammaproteobacteria bacterium]